MRPSSACPFRRSSVRCASVRNFSGTGGGGGLPSVSRSFVRTDAVRGAPVNAVQSLASRDCQRSAAVRQRPTSDFCAGDSRFSAAAPAIASGRAGGVLAPPSGSAERKTRTPGSLPSVTRPGATASRSRAAGMTARSSTGCFCSTCRRTASGGRGHLIHAAKAVPASTRAGSRSVWRTTSAPSWLPSRVTGVHTPVSRHTTSAEEAARRTSRTASTGAGTVPAASV
jgi:hypothetical protein